MDGVTKQEQIEWFADRYESWPVTDGYVAMSGYVLGLPGATHYITKEEWQQERDKMQKQDNSWHERGELPPVGCECEYKPANDWVKCKVLFAGDSIYVLGVQEFEICARVLDVEFRPLRTEREKAIEEMVSILVGCEKYAITQNVAAAASELLYGAGYRKVDSK